MSDFTKILEKLLCFINQWGPLVIELIKAFAWPITLVFVLLFFKSEIRTLIPRLKKASLSGVELNDEAEKQSDTTKLVANLSNISSDKLTQFEGIHRTKAMTELELSLKADLKKIADQNNFDSEKTIDYVINRLAMERLLKQFDYIYRGIFGSQLSFIYKLKSSDLSKNNARKFFDEANNQDTEFYKGYTFSKWINYLKNMNLIHESNSKFIITPVGIDFLQYMLDNALSPDKRG
jgi:hypothetical protein